MEVLWLQERCGIHGDLAEIGVFQGKSFLALAAGASVGERLIAVDIFDSLDVVAQRPEHDVTDYGQGNEARFRANLAEYFPGTEVTVIARSSSDLRGQEREFGLTNLRFLSIDGGHTSQLTVNDLRIADTSLTEDGLCCLDDVLNPHWLGVISGLFEFLQSRPALVPVALFPNKLFLSRPARKHFYGDAFRRLFPETLERESVELHRSDVDVFGDTWPRMSATLNALTAAAAGADPAAATAGKLSTLAHTEAETRTAAAEVRAFAAEAAARTATDRANRAERKLVKRKSRRAWAFRFGRAERAARPDQTRADALSDEGFDEPWYLRTYPDVSAAIACGDFPSGLAHFRIHGLREGRRRSAVDAGAPGGSCDAASSADDRRRQISAVWSADAAERAARCGWYWLAHPMVVARVNTLISGDPGCDAYGRLERLLRERGWNLPIPRAVSLGCGFGNLERDLAQRGLVQDIAGYDLAEGAVAEARRLACEAGLDALRYHVADLDALSFEKASLDAVFAHQAVHHVEETGIALRVDPRRIASRRDFPPARVCWTKPVSVDRFPACRRQRLFILTAARATPPPRRPAETVAAATEHRGDDRRRSQRGGPLRRHSGRPERHVRDP